MKKKFSSIPIKFLSCMFLVFCLNFNFSFLNQIEDVPIYFEEYDITIEELPRTVTDTLIYEKSNREYFKIVLFDKKGKSYCERYVNKLCCEKGNFENSIDTLKRYVSGRDLNGQRSPIVVQKYFEPLKDGDWFMYKNGKKIKQSYKMGVLQKNN